jgi:hypothetical protein
MRSLRPAPGLVVLGLLVLLAAASACGARTTLSAGEAGDVTSSTGGGGAPSTTGSSATGAGGDGPSCTSVVLATDPKGASYLSRWGDTIFWTTGDAQIMRAPLAGGPATMIAQAGGTPLGLTNDGAWVYWTEPTRLLRQAFGGGAPELLAEGQHNATWPAVVGEDVYWINAGSGIFAGEIVHRRPDGSIEVLVDQIDLPRWMRVDETHAYFLAEGLQIPSGTIFGVLGRVPLSGGPAEALLIGAHQPSTLALSSDAITWVDQLDESLELSATVFTMPKSGGTRTLLGHVPERLGIGVGVDDGNAYVTTFHGTLGGALFRLPLAGGEPLELASQPGKNLYADVVVTGDSVVWTAAWNPGDMPAGTPSVRKLCK